jgi:outer membrane protein assembly factor BamB
MYRLNLFLALMVAAGSAAGPVVAQDASRRDAHWPQFRGPNGQGVAPEGMTLPVRFGPSAHVVWKTPLPPGHSSPCVWGDRIFLTAFDKAGPKLETLGLDRRTGQIFWRQTAPAAAIEKVHQISSPAVATPATDGERVYVYFGSYGLLCYDLDGREQWKVPLPVPTTRFGTGTSPVVAGDVVLLNGEYPPKPFLLAVNRRTGATVWRKEHPGPMEGYSTPVVWSHDGVDEVIVHSPARLAAYGLTDGAEHWRVGVFSTACSSPVVADGRLFVATYMLGAEPEERVPLPTFDQLLEKYDKNKDGMISKQEFPADLSVFQRPEAAGVPGADVKLRPFFDQLDLNKDGQIARWEWALVTAFASRQPEHGLLAIRPGGQGDVTRTHVLWREKRAVPEVPSPVAYRGRVYTVKDGGLVSCLDAASGKLLYRERLGPGGAYYSSPVAGDGKLYAASARGTVTVFAAGDGFRVLARNDLREPIVATPALADGKLYVRTASHLYAFGE